LLTAAAPDDPDDPANLAAYAALAPHVLATAPLGDHSAAGRRLVLNTIRHLQAHGNSSGSHAARAVAEQLLDRCRSILGPDHPDTLTAASTLIPCPGLAGRGRPAPWARTPCSAAAGCSARTTRPPWERRPLSPSPWSSWARPSGPAPWAGTPCSAPAECSARTTPSPCT